jgi:hypothetical protein
VTPSPLWSGNSSRHSSEDGSPPPALRTPPPSEPLWPYTP